MDLTGKKIFVILGASGSGKDTVAKAVFPKLGIPELVSDTTRKPREGDVNGINYHFYDTKEEFFNVEKIEWAEYPKGSGRYYGLSVAEVESKLSKYDTVYAVMEIDGARFLKERYPEQTTIINCYLTLEEMEKRMRLRGDSEDSIQERLLGAKNSGEFQNYVYADYVISNINLEDSISRLTTIVTLQKRDMEIERKFLIKELPDISNLPKHEITQGYIGYSPEERIRREDYKFFKTIKSEGGLVRNECNIEISETEYVRLLNQIKDNIIQKTRYYMLHGNHRVEIDLYHKNLEGLIVAEVEFMSQEEADAFTQPFWFGREITEDISFKNKNLARYGMCSSL